MTKRFLKNWISILFAAVTIIFLTSGICSPAKAQTIVRPDYNMPYYQGSVRVHDTLGVDDKLIVGSSYTTAPFIVNVNTSTALDGIFVRNISSGAYGSQFQFYKSRNGAACQNIDQLGLIGWVYKTSASQDTAGVINVKIMDVATNKAKMQIYVNNGSINMGDALGSDGITLYDNKLGVGLNYGSIDSLFTSVGIHSTTGIRAENIIQGQEFLGDSISITGGSNVFYINNDILKSSTVAGRKPGIRATYMNGNSRYGVLAGDAGSGVRYYASLGWTSNNLTKASVYYADSLKADMQYAITNNFNEWKMSASEIAYIHGYYAGSNLKKFVVDTSGKAYLPIQPPNASSDTSAYKPMFWRASDGVLTVGQAAVVTPAWYLTGNTVGAATDWIGTVDNYSFNVRTNNVPKIKVDSATNGIYFLSTAGAEYARIWTNAVSNFFAGYRSASSGSLSGLYNTFVGSNTGIVNTSGQRNTFIGETSGYSNLTGSYCTFVGQSAGYVNDASSNTFIGALSGVTNTSGHSNTFVGGSAGATNLTAQRNTFVGQAAGYTNSSGNYNTYIGQDCGYNATGSGNIFLGYDAGFYQVGGSNRLIIHNSVLSAADTTGYAISGIMASGLNKIMINGDPDNGVANFTVQGGAAMTAANIRVPGVTGATLPLLIESGGSNDDILWVNDTGTVFSKGALYLTDNSSTEIARIWTNAATNMFAGYQVGKSITSGTYNTYLGYAVGSVETTGLGNTGVGGDVLLANNGGNYNTAIGVSALRTVITGVENTAIGFDALRTTTGNYNTSIGSQSCRSITTGVENIGIGYYALNTTTTGINNIALGIASGYGNLGSNNIFVGYYGGRRQAGSNKLVIHSTTSDNDTTGYAISGIMSSGLNKIMINGDPDNADSTFVVGNDSPNNASIHVNGNALFDRTITYAPVNTGQVDSTVGITKSMLAADMRYNCSYHIQSIDANPQIAAGVNGMIIEITGTSDANYLLLVNGTGLKLAGGISFKLGLDDVISFRYNGTNWIERFRSDQ